MAMRSSNRATFNPQLSVCVTRLTPATRNIGELARVSRLMVEDQATPTGSPQHRLLNASVDGTRAPWRGITTLRYPMPTFTGPSGRIAVFQYGTQQTAGDCFGLLRLAVKRSDVTLRVKQPAFREP